MQSVMEPIYEIDGKKIKEMVDLPVGEFVKIARKYDPLWGRDSQGKIYKVKFKLTEKYLIERLYSGEIMVPAASKKEAEKAIKEMNENELAELSYKWVEYDGDEQFEESDFEIESVERANA